MRTKSNPTCSGIELEDLYNRVSIFYNDNWLEYWDNKDIDAKLKEAGKLLSEALNLMELELKNNNQVKLENWINRSLNK